MLENKNRTSFMDEESMNPFFAFDFAKYSFSSLIYTCVHYEYTIIDEPKFIRLENTSKSVKIEVTIDR